MNPMLPPHGSKLIDRFVGEERANVIKSEFGDLTTIMLDENLFYDFSNISRGVFSPLKGFMGRNDFLKVVNDLTLEDGTVWTLPIVLDIGPELANRISPGDRVGLQSPSGKPAGVIDVDSVYRYNAEDCCKKLFGTTDDAHPGVRMFQSKGSFFLGGDIKAFRDAIPRGNSFDLSPKEMRVLFKNRGWDSVVGFQTRNVPHRAHEYLQKSALEHVDGLLIQPKMGEKKPGDYSNDAILAGYQSLIENYYPSDSVVLATFKSRMAYAGPREAVFDAIVRKNFGCTHFIIGRDHAGVGDFYGDFESQKLFEDVGDIGIEPLYYHHAFFCTVCDGIVSEKLCPHADHHHIEPSGTELRQTLADRQLPSPELMRPEVAETILSLEQMFD